METSLYANLPVWHTSADNRSCVARARGSNLEVLLGAPFKTTFVDRVIISRVGHETPSRRKGEKNKERNSCREGTTTARNVLLRALTAGRTRKPQLSLNQNRVQKPRDVYTSCTGCRHQASVLHFQCLLSGFSRNAPILSAQTSETHISVRLASVISCRIDVLITKCNGCNKRQITGSVCR